MTRYRILPYRQGSKSARALADALGGKVLKLEGSKFKPKPDDIIVNWGNTTPSYSTPPILNPWHVIKQASNKLLFFKAMQEVNPDLTPKFWTSKEDIPDDAYPVVCRTVLAGHSGDGIVIADTVSDLVDASLYVKYEKKKDEYRVHVGRIPYKQTSLDVLGDPDEVDNINGYEYKIIAVQRKARRNGHENPNWQVRNHSNGFVFVRGGLNPPPPVLAVASQALTASGLDFGAVDVIWNAQQEKPYVLEINTAPGLEGQTVADYAKFFSKGN